ncbi:MAG: DUF6456 domain-containing protein [Pseudomonadota bacterium]
MNTSQILEQCRVQAAHLFRERSSACSAEDAGIYLAHTVQGQSIRAIAAVTGTHPSTVLRTVRRIEERRDDPLLDRLLEDLEQASEGQAGGEAGPALGAASAPAGEAMAAGADADQIRIDAPGLPAVMAEETVAREARRYLRRLCEPDAFLLIAQGAEKAGVFCASNAHRKPIALFPVELAAEFLRRDWIRVLRKATATVRYAITETGRAFLRRALAEEAERKRRAASPCAGLAEAATPFQQQHRLETARVFLQPPEGAEEAALTVNLGESPLGWLARRRGPGGTAYLGATEVEAGERLRSDFEHAQMGPNVTQDWRRFLTPSDRYSGSPSGRGPADGPQAARSRVSAALTELGPGLADVAFRVCCFLEGLEACEKRMGWSARSGKVVLKLALQRLAQHYGIGDGQH